jgi:hypothetical protein
MSFEPLREQGRTIQQIAAALTGLPLSSNVFVALTWQIPPSRAKCEDIVGSDPILAGAVGTTPEIHEKISQQTGKGAVVLFATTNGTFKYITAHRPSKNFLPSSAGFGLPTGGGLPICKCPAN